MEFLNFAASHYAWAAALALGAWCWGRGMAARIAFASWPEQLAVRTGLGLAAIGTALHVLALLVLLRREVILPVLVLGALAGLIPPGVPPSRSAAISRGTRLARLVPLLLLLAAPLLLSPLLTLPLFPPVEWDATAYHLEFARAFVHGHGFQPTPWVRYPHFPQFQETLFAMALALKDDLLAQLLQLLSAALTAVLLHAWGLRWGSWRAGIWAACLWIGASLVLELAPIAYIDCGCTFFSTLAIYSCWISRQERSAAWALLAGVFAGTAAASKYSALFFCLALFTALAISGARTGRWRLPWLFALGAALLAAPWYARNWIHSGNPFFPFFPRIFGKSSWNAADLMGQMADLRANGLARSPGGVASSLWHLWARHGDLTARKLASGMSLGGAAGVLGFLALVAWPESRRLTLLVIAFLAYWFYSAPQARYLLPILPCLLILKCLLADRALSRIPLRGTEGILAAVTLAGGLLLLRDGRLHTANIVRGRGEVPLRPAAREAHLLRELPTRSYGAIQRLRELHGTHSATYALYAENMFYYADGTWIGDWFGPGRFSRVLVSLPSSRDLFAQLRSMGADHFLVNTSRYSVALPRDDYFARHFHLEYQSPNVQLFELRELP